MNYENTLKESINRIENLVHDVQYAEAGYPLFNWLEISPIDKCNRACVFCPRADPAIAPNQNNFMPESLYGKLAEELLRMDYQGTVMIAGYGEPMASKLIYKMTKRFAAICHTEITTNGDFLKPANIEKLLDAGVGKISVSLYDGPEQIDYFTKLFDEVGVPKSRYILRDRWYTSEDDFGVKLTNRAGTTNIGDQKVVNTEKKCFYTHYSMMIDWNGDAFLCTQDWNRRIRSGNLALNSLIEVWTSATLKKYRRRLAKGQRDLSPCNKCNADGTLHGQNHATAWESFYTHG
jgi:radical SAM protein with 4Fe4S-binding SPASM domain